MSRWTPGKKARNGAGRAYVGFWFHCSPNPYQRSAEQGHTQAQVKLAEMYAEGADKGLHVQGFVMAYKWLSLAAAAGEPTAKELIQVYSTRMEPEQVAEAESLAQEWLSQKRAS